MKVQLIVVQGKPEGMVIPLKEPIFRIGRANTCHLRPNNEQVSREHTEISVGPDTVTARDLGSRNGTIVNGKTITGREALKNGDLIQVGPLTFSVIITGAPAVSGEKPTAPKPQAASKGASLDDVSHDQIDSWLIADTGQSPPESPSGVYGGDTMTMSAYKGTTAKAAATPPPAVAKPADAAPPPPVAKPAAAAFKPASPAPNAPPTSSVGKKDQAAPARFDDENVEYERLDEGMGDDDPDEIAGEAEESEPEMPEEFIDESNPFYAAKKPKEEAAAKAAYKDSSDAAHDILRKMLERRKASKSS